MKYYDVTVHFNLEASDEQSAELIVNNCIDTGLVKHGMIRVELTDVEELVECQGIVPDFTLNRKDK